MTGVIFFAFSLTYNRLILYFLCLQALIHVYIENQPNQVNFYTEYNFDM